MNETLSKHPLFKAIGNRVYDMEIQGLMLDLKIMLGGLEHNRDLWRRRAIREARKRIRIAGERNELLAAIQRLPEPPVGYGDGPDERVGWILEEHKANKALRICVEQNLRAAQHAEAEVERLQKEAMIWCKHSQVAWGEVTRLTELSQEKVTVWDASFDIKQRLVVAEARLAALREQSAFKEFSEPGLVVRLHLPDYNEAAWNIEGQYFYPQFKSYAEYREFHDKRKDMETGIGLITAERKRQVEEEGWTPQHDDQHTDYQLLGAAMCYCLASSSHILGLYWPTGWGKKWWKPTIRIRDLTKAGALIAAEIDRLQRAEPQE